MKPAQYVCPRDNPTVALLHHYALAMPVYTHFTSPIRRYADIMVHRLLDATLRHSKPEDVMANFPLSPTETAELCERCNEKKEASKKAQDASDKLFLCVFLRRHGPIEEDGICVGIGGKSFTIFIPRLDLERRVNEKELQVR